jgi:hypothetical protein
MEADSPGWTKPMWSQPPAATAGSSPEAVAEHGLGNTGYERTARPAAQNIPIKKSNTRECSLEIILTFAPSKIAHYRQCFYTVYGTQNTLLRNSKTKNKWP